MQAKSESGDPGIPALYFSHPSTGVKPAFDSRNESEPVADGSRETPCRRSRRDRLFDLRSEGKRITFASVEDQVSKSRAHVEGEGCMPKSTQGGKAMPRELADALSTLLAEALVADVKLRPDLSMETGAGRNAGVQQSSSYAEPSSAQATPSPTPATAADDPAGCAHPLPPLAHRPFLDALAELIASEAIRRSRSEQEVVKERGDAPRLDARHLRDDQGQRVLKPKGRLLTIQEAADYLAISPASLRKRGWQIKNRLPAIKLGRSVRFDILMLDRWIERHTEHLPRLFHESDEP